VAIVDPASNAVVIRVVYDGAPLAGKTTSVGALGQSLGAPVHSPAEIGGRTLYFDWLDYTGGLFEGRRIRCQIVSAPGQASLAARRRRLLESADVVVFVGDSSPAGFEADRSYLRSLASVLRQLDGPPVGIVLQANKRDLPDAVPIEQMQTMLDDAQLKVGIVETVATDGSGVREAFVFAVRLALDRVRELMRLGHLGTGRPDIDTPEDLLADLRARDGAAHALAVQSNLLHTRLGDLRPSSLAAEGLRQAIQSEQQSRAAARISQTGLQPSGPPALPSEHVASGLVWPPVNGRMILHDIGRSGAELQRLADGGWLGRVANRWQIRAPADEVFDTVEHGRPALIELARACAVKCRSDSVERCVVLASDGAGRMRLWRIERLG